MNWKRAYATIQLDEREWFTKYKRLAEKESHHILLESGRGGAYSIIGLKPFALISGKDNELVVKSRDRRMTKTGPLLTSLKEVLSPYHVETDPSLPPFQGGAIGFISYDVVREIERIEDQAIDDIGLPDVYFMLFANVYVYDHVKKCLFIIVYGEDEHELELRLEHDKEIWRMKGRGEATQKRERKRAVKKWQDSLSEEAFCDAVEKIKEYIKSGDVYQVNLSMRQTKELRVDPFDVYEMLRDLNPSPYMAYVESPDFQLVSGSPELLIKKDGRKLNARPIAGTRSRGKDENEDASLAASLINNEKERAEHMMLVDLERNDIGRVSEYGTVNVNELMVIEKYSHVMHIVSNVQGELAKGNDLYDVIRAKFPGGTITGAPKIRTMEIIEELEPVKRGVYTGSIGWIGFDGNMELNIAIRTMICKDGYAHVQAGAGIVIDSEPKREYKESQKKARALWRALQLTEQAVGGKE